MRAARVDSPALGSAFGGLGNQDLFGSSLAWLGDVDADGTSELLVGALGDDDGGLSHGAVWLLGLDATGVPGAVRKLSSTGGSFPGTLERNDAFGSAMAPLGDLDRDGRLDVAVGAGGDDDGGTDRGAVWMLFLDTTPAGALAVRSGSVGNPAVLSAPLPPRVGEVWEVQVDCRLRRPGRVWHVAVDAPAPGPLRLAGELLIDTRLPQRLRALGTHRSDIVTFRHRIPNDPALHGHWLYTQAVVTGAPGALLSNALDARIGP